jgi:hypothetical protein
MDLTMTLQSHIVENALTVDYVDGAIMAYS